MNEMGFISIDGIHFAIDGIHFAMRRGFRSPNRARPYQDGKKRPNRYQALNLDTHRGHRVISRDPHHEGYS